MAVVTARIDDNKKTQLFQICKNMGVSVWTLINMRVTDFVRHPRINIDYTDDTHASFYDHPDAIKVDEPIEVVHDYLSTLVKKDEQTTTKIPS